MLLVVVLVVMIMVLVLILVMLSNLVVIAIVIDQITCLRVLHSIDYTDWEVGLQLQKRERERRERESRVGWGDVCLRSRLIV